MIRMLLTLAALAGPPPLAAQPASCPPPAGFAGWRDAAAPVLPIRPGAAVELALKPVGEVRWSTPPTRPPAAGSYGAEVILEAPRAGLYHVALGAPAWIDLLRDGKAAPSVDHRHGEPCSGIAKIVGFRLEAGRYRVQLSGSPDAAMRMMISAGE